MAEARDGAAFQRVMAACLLCLGASITAAEEGGRARGAAPLCPAEESDFRATLRPDLIAGRLRSGQRGAGSRYVSTGLQRRLIRRSIGSISCARRRVSWGTAGVS